MEKSVEKGVIFIPCFSKHKSERLICMAEVTSKKLPFLNLLFSITAE